MNLLQTLRVILSALSLTFFTANFPAQDDFGEIEMHPHALIKPAFLALSALQCLRYKRHMDRILWSSHAYRSALVHNRLPIAPLHQREWTETFNHARNRFRGWGALTTGTALSFAHGHLTS